MITKRFLLVIALLIAVYGIGVHIYTSSKKRESFIEEDNETQSAGELIGEIRGLLNKLEKKVSGSYASGSSGSSVSSVSSGSSSTPLSTKESGANTSQNTGVSTFRQRYELKDKKESDHEASDHEEKEEHEYQDSDHEDQEDQDVKETFVSAPRTAYRRRVAPPSRMGDQRVRSNHKACMNGFEHINSLSRGYMLL
jgi:hypothetical protein